jgi:hypothetical protein
MARRRISARGQPSDKSAQIYVHQDRAVRERELRGQSLPRIQRGGFVMRMIILANHSEE